MRKRYPIIGIFLALLFIMLMAFAVKSAFGGITPVLGTAVLDGVPDEWTADRKLADMHQAGKPEKPMLAELYGAYDCDGNTLYIYVVSLFGPIEVDDEEVFMKLNDSVVLDGSDSPPDGSLPDLAWIGDSAFEAAVSVDPGTYDMRVHVNVLVNEFETADVRARLAIGCPTAVTLHSSPTATGDNGFVWFSIVILAWFLGAATSWLVFDIERRRKR